MIDLSKIEGKVWAYVTPRVWNFTGKSHWEYVTADELDYVVIFGEWAIQKIQKEKPEEL